MPARWVLLALAVLAALWLLLVSLPYRPPESSLVSDNVGWAYSPLMTHYLSYVFEDSEDPLRAKLGAKESEISVSYRRALVRLTMPDGTEKRIQLGKNAPDAFDLGYAKLRFLGDFSEQEKEQTLVSLSDPAKDLDRWMPDAAKQERLVMHWSKSDLYAHGVTLLMALALGGILIWAASARFRREDLPLLVVLGLGAFNLFVMTETGLGDIKLHFFNEARQIYQWDLYGPGNFALQKILYRLFGASDEVLFNANRLFGLFSAVPLYLFARQGLGSRYAGLGAAFLLLTHPTWLRYASSDLTHPWAFFFFFCALALIVQEELPGPGRIVAAFSLLALAMLGRGEFMILCVAALPLVGYTRIRALLSRHPRAVLYGATFCALAVLPQVIALAAQVNVDPEKLVKLNLRLAARAWFWLDGLNTYADTRWSPWPHIVLTAFGFFFLLVRRPFAALGLFAAAALFLWNPYVFQDMFSSTHYQLAALPFYILLGGAGIEGLRRLLAKASLGSRRAALAALAVGIFISAVLGYPELLEGRFTFMDQYRWLKAERHLVDPNCALVFVRTPGDHDLFNPEQVWFADPEPLPAAVNLVTTPLPELVDCLTYIRTPACRVFEEEAELPSDWNLRLCERFEGQMERTPLWEGAIPARRVCTERYIDDPIPVGLYRVERWQGKPLTNLEP